MQKKNIAMLIDGDNAQAKYLQSITEETSKYGTITIKRIYGDWSSGTMKNWKEQLSTYAIKPVQKFAYTKGKNSTDIALIIDAMDILHSKKVDGFCIVSSDSDFTGLANRIREDGLTVIGIGKKQTPKSFINACEIFTFTENFEKNNSKSKTTKIDLKFLRKAFSMVEQENGEAFLSQIAQAIRELDSSFDPRTYGFKNFNMLFKSLDEFKLIYHKDNSTISIKEIRK